jgi:DME family drug/metabolite transporter
MHKLRPATLGILCCAVAAVSYTSSNICMRQVSALEVDPTWAVCIKELVTVLLVGPYLLYRMLRGWPVWPPLKILLILILAGLADQLVGNLGMQTAFGVVGLAVTIPIVFGTMITGSAVFGRILLGEKVSSRTMGAIGLLLLALLLLSLGAESAGKTIAENLQPSGAVPGPATALVFVQAVLVAAAAGAAFALLTIAIRHTMNAAAQQSSLMCIITGIGVITLGPISIHRLGLEAVLATSPEQFAWMLAAGVFNLLGFMGITKGLHLTAVVHANVLNASQVAMAALAGMIFFHEPPNSWLLLGIILTLLGIFFIDRRTAEETVEQTL